MKREQGTKAQIKKKGSTTYREERFRVVTLGETAGDARGCNIV
jgi:hypothetical protein